MRAQHRRWSHRGLYIGQQQREMYRNGKRSSEVQGSTIINWLDICAAMLHYSKPKPGTSPCFLASTHLLVLTNNVRALAPCDSATLLRSPTQVVWRASLRSARPAVRGFRRVAMPRSMRCRGVQLADWRQLAAYSTYFEGVKRSLSAAFYMCGSQSTSALYAQERSKSSTEVCSL
jgi:hypothetical protein